MGRKLSPQEMIERIEQKLSGCPMRSYLWSPAHARVLNQHEVVNRIQQIGVIINRIEGDLNKKMFFPNELFSSLGQYERWCSRARKVLGPLRQEHQDLRTALKEMRRKADAISLGIDDPHDPYQFLGACHGALISLMRRLGWDVFTEEEQGVIHASEEFLRKFRPIEVPPGFISYPLDDLLDDGEESDPDPGFRELAREIEGDWSPNGQDRGSKR